MINSNIKHNLAVDSEYNKRRISYENIVKKIKQTKPKVNSLRDVTLEDLLIVADKTNPVDIKGAKKNEHVRKMMKALTIGEGLEGVIGSRMMGGGFGGCTINLIKTAELESSITSLLEAYKEHTGIDAEYYHLAIDEGIKVYQ